jgi:hypothetical protein
MLKVLTQRQRNIQGHKNILTGPSARSIVSTYLKLHTDIIPGQNLSNSDIFTENLTDCQLHSLSIRTYAKILSLIKFQLNFVLRITTKKP